MIDTVTEANRHRSWHDYIVFTAEDSREWHAAWEALGRESGDSDCTALSPIGEVWQYMGSVTRGRLWVHEFRHRDHPRSRQRWLLRVRASRRWKPRPGDSLLSRA